MRFLVMSDESNISNQLFIDIRIPNFKRDHCISNLLLITQIKCAGLNNK